MVAFAVIFLVVLFSLKNKTVFKNEVNQQQGLTYGNEIVGDLVSKDTDGDGVLDWEESLWGTDPTKKETTPGIKDSVAIEKLKSQTEESGQISSINQKEEKLTETDKFSRELFSTVASLNQAGAMDQTTVDKLSSSLVEQVQSSSPRKVFTISNLKIINNNTSGAVQDYANTLSGIFRKYAIKTSVADILAESITSSGDIDVKVLNKLDPIILNMNGIVSKMLTMNVPQSIAYLHLNILNGFQKLEENLSDVKLIDTDIILAVGAISQYQKNDEELNSSIDKLTSTVNQRLNN